MARKIVRLRPEHVDALDVPCRECLFWELGPRRGGGDGAGYGDGHAAGSGEVAGKAAWVARVLDEWGDCGQVALVDGEPVAYLAYAPDSFVPGAAALPTAPVSPDAVLLTAVHVAAAHTGGGVARMLVQRMARDLVEREVRAVEAFGDTTGAARCVLSVELLDRLGFRLHRGHVTTPRLRMDLRTTVTWRTPVEAAWERLVGAVRPVPRPTRGVAPRVAGPAPGETGGGPGGRLR